MDASDWIALGAVVVSIVSVVVGYRVSRRSAVASETSSTAAVQSATSSASSADASRRSAEVAERTEERALADREDARGPVFRVGDQQDQGARARVTLQGDRAHVRIVQASGPELEKVVVSARGPVDGVMSPEGAGGHWWTWDRPILYDQTMVFVVGNRPDRVLDAELVLECYELEPGKGRWERRYPAHAVASAYGPSPPP